jgi:hypothetical protein
MSYIASAIWGGTVCERLSAKRVSVDVGGLIGGSGLAAKGSGSSKTVGRLTAQPTQLSC